MTRLLDHHLSTGAVEPGVRTAARLLATDPLQERAHRILMELYYRQGRYAAALRQYQMDPATWHPASQTFYAIENRPAEALSVLLH